MEAQRAEALQKENEEYRQKLEMYENCIDAELERRLNEKLATYNSSHTSIIERLSQLEKQKESANEVNQKLGVVEKASAEKTTKIDSLMKENSELETRIDQLMTSNGELAKKAKSMGDNVQLQREIDALKDKLKEERKKSQMTATEQITRLEAAGKTADKQAETYKKKVENQKTEIARLMAVNEKLTSEKKGKQTAIDHEAEKRAKTEKDKDEKINSLSKVNTQLEENIALLTERSASMKKQLDEAVEDREHLRIQVANSATDRSKAMIAMELTNGFNKLIDQAFGANKAGGDGKSMLETLQSEVTKQEEMISDMKSCQICCHPFDNDNRVPAKGKCPHAIYCMACLRSVAKGKNAACPTCREPLKGDDIVAVKLNFV